MNLPALALGRRHWALEQIALVEEAHTDVLNDVPQKAGLRIETIQSVAPCVTGAAEDVAVCVVRCVEGTAQLGMVFQRPGPTVGKGTAEAGFVLTAIEWYGKQVEQLDTVHSGKVTLTGAGAATLAERDVLNSVPLH
ncbi:hypothetical protein ACIP3U_13005 [[Kitasatospora] papulosa]|uniref:hypothetical protein n=1 Tax=[Kitasatospora] papulosa TaxID=1464011 RepID=UPI0038200938